MRLEFCLHTIRAMHVRQTKYAYHLLNSGPSARSVATATAAAVKPSVSTPVRGWLVDYS